MHAPYEGRLNHKSDFRVRYKFYKPEEGGRTHLPFQGIRSDFWYHHPENKEGSVFIIWPEFEDETRNVILDNTRPVPESGTARMWIIMNKMRRYHQNKIQIGTTGFFLEGVKTAECEVIEILGLLDNPIE